MANGVSINTLITNFTISFSHTLLFINFNPLPTFKSSIECQKMGPMQPMVPSRWCLHFVVVGGLVWSKDPESCAGGSFATGRVSHAGVVEGDDTD
jgi:hypothetical protein